MAGKIKDAVQPRNLTMESRTTRGDGTISGAVPHPGDNTYWRAIVPPGKASSKPGRTDFNCLPAGSPADKISAEIEVELLLTVAASSLEMTRLAEDLP